MLALASFLITSCAPPEKSAIASSPADVASFEGTIFVFTTDLATGLWSSAGWRISEMPLDTANQDIPLDCTLYPHSGVANQWVGGCSGHIDVPRGGANHIAVMVAHLDGSTTLVQVAPTPVAPAP